MKIGIISMHRIRNNGSFLQAYGLYNTIKKYGHDVEFIDFKNQLLERSMNRKSPSATVKILKSAKHLFSSYLRKCDIINKNNALFNELLCKLFSLINIKEENNYASDKEYDLLVVGSDEVFNICQFSDENVYIPLELFGKNIKTKKIISYAAACGQTNTGKLKKIGLDKEIAGLLNNFSHISVRDRATYSLVKELTGKEASVNIDPVLMYNDFPKEENYKPLKEKYMIIYAYTHRINDIKEISKIKAYAKEHNLKTVCVNNFQYWCDKMIVASPFALLQYIKDAQCVVTDTFHGTVFSIKKNVPFVTLVRDSNRNKLTGLLAQFSLTDRIFEKEDSLEEKFADSIDFDTVNSLIIKEQEKSINYLEKWLK